MLNDNHQPAALTPEGGPNLVVVFMVPAAESRARELADALNAPLQPFEGSSAADNPVYAFELQVDAEQTQLQPRAYKSGPVGIDFTSGSNLHRLIRGGGINQTLARAVGLTRRDRQAQTRPMHVLDATSGFLKDSWALAALGCRITALEQCLWLHWMQKEALERASKRCADVSDHQLLSDELRARVSSSINNINPVHADAVGWFHNVTTEADPEATLAAHTVAPVDTIYLDPMYPERKKSAAVKKEMQALHAFLATTTDADTLLQAATQSAEVLHTTRVVIKRPRSAPTLTVPDGWHTGQPLASENTRYDVYLRPVDD